MYYLATENVAIKQKGNVQKIYVKKKQLWFWLQ